MPLQRCTADGQDGWKYGDSGKCYTGPGAKKHAIRQGLAMTGGTLEGAELSTDRRNALKDSDFAVPGKRALPLYDAAHVRAALARFNQTKGLTPEEKAAAKTRIKAAAKKFGIEVSDDFSEWAKFAEPLLVAGPDQPIELPADFGEVVQLPLVSVGEWTFRDYGNVAVSDADLDQIVENFQRDVRRQDLPLCINEEHAPLPLDVDPSTYVGPGAVGWIKDLKRDGDTVYADVELNRLGEQLIRDDRYRAVSPELLLDWTDPETEVGHGKTATGLALTTMPRMKGLAHRGGPLAALAASEGRVLAFAELQDVHIDSAMPNLSVSYAYPKSQRLPLSSPASVLGAKARFMTVQASESERDEAWGRLKEAAKQHGVDVPETWRALKASECAALLMQEADGMTDDDADLPPPCQYQPPFGCCPGYTRSDPDNDGDADCCLMASRGCNGYIPLIAARAVLPDSESGPYGYSEPLKKGPTGGPTLTEDTKEQTAGAAAPETGAGVKASEPPSDQPKPEPQKAPEPQPEPIAASAPADFAELKNMLAAEQRERQAQATRLEAAERDAKTAREQVRLMKEAGEMAVVADRVEALKRSGRITPADEEDLQKAGYARFSEDDTLLRIFERRAANSAVDMSERGSGESSDGRDTKDVIAERAQQILTASKQTGQPLSPKQAYLKAGEELVAKNRLGYQG